MTLGEKIRVARLERKLTQEQLAGRDLTKSYISELERGLRRPRLITLRVLARRLNLPVSHFQEGVPEDQEAEALLHLGLAHFHAKSVEEGNAVLSRALELATQQGDEVLQARIELALALFDRVQGRLTLAQRRLERSLRALARTGDTGLLSAAHSLLGQTKMEAGDAVSALWAFRTALQLAEHMPGDPALLSSLHLQLGGATRRLGDIRGAEEAYRRGLEAGVGIQDEQRMASWHLNRSGAAVTQGHFEEVLQHAGKALAIYEACAHKRRLADLHEGLAEIDIEDGHWEEARHHYQWSLALNGAAAHLDGAAQTLARLAEVLLTHGSTEAACVMCEAALGLLSGESDRGRRAQILRIQGAICRVLGRREEAKTAFEESLSLFTELRRSGDIRRVRQELALLAIETQDLAEAHQQLQMLREEPVRLERDPPTRF